MGTDQEKGLPYKTFQGLRQQLVFIFLSLGGDDYNDRLLCLSHDG